MTAFVEAVVPVVPVVPLAWRVGTWRLILMPEEFNRRL